jgi:hypothetical protein
MGKGTIHALLARGFDSETAKTLDANGHTCGSLKNMKFDDLRALNIAEAQIRMILNETRPPIPSETLIKVLQESRWTCCICRNRTQGVIVHHIDEYSNSRNHNEDNLVVLCLNHHGEAHTKRDLQLNLTSKKLKEAKRWWIDFVQKCDLQAVLSKTPSYSCSIWDYFNHRRLIDLSQQLRINISKLRNYSTLLEENRINSDGSPAWASPEANRYMYDFLYASREPYTFYSDLIKKILDNTKWVNLHFENWNYSSVNSIVKENTIVVCKGAFYFKDLSRHQSFGANQMREGLRRCNGIHLKFQFDAWETTSSSAYSSHLSGRNVTTLVCLIRSKSKSEKHLILNSSALAIGSGFGSPHNEYKPSENEEFNLGF